MKTYEILIHPVPTVVRVSAQSLDQAKRMAADIAGGDATKPATFGHWRIIPTARQIARTKSLMRGI